MNESEVVHQKLVPDGWYMGAHGDPIATFDRGAALVLRFHADRSVSWALLDKDGNDIGDQA